MITEDYVSFETAKLLKEKGFDGECSCYYFFKDKAQFEESLTHWNWNDGYTFRYSAPTLQMTMKWLREEHDLHIDIFVTYKDGIPHYQWSVDNLKTQDTISETPCCNAYEEACEAAIKYCLKNLI